MTITFGNAPIFTTTISSNEIVISPIGDGGSTIANTSVDRLGYTTSFGNTTIWQNPIWFRFYEPIETNIPFTTIRTFQEIDIETKFGASFTQADIDKMLSLMFLNYYNTTPPLKADILTSVPTISNIFERLNGDPITNAWETTIPDIATAPTSKIKAIALFQDFGIGFTTSYPLNYGGDQTIGNIYKEVHLTSIDPLADPNTNPAKYRYLSSTEEQILSTAGNRKKGMIIYTNLFDGAFSNAGMMHYFQFLAIWPIIARILQQIQAFGTTYDPIAYTNSLMDSTILQRGLGYFNRISRVDTTNGWFGNSIFSFANSFSLTSPFALQDSNPIIAPFIGCSEYLIMKEMESTFAPSDPLPFINNTPCIWVGNNPNGNFTLENAKSYIRIVMYFTACIQRLGQANAKNVVITPTETNIKNFYGFANISTYYQGCANKLSIGQYAHFFRFAQTIAYDLSNVFDTFIAPYIPSWSASISGLQLIALDKYSTNTTNAFLTPMTNIIPYYNSLGFTAMDSTQETNLTLYTYP